MARWSRGDSFFTGLAFPLKKCRGVLALSYAAAAPGPANTAAAAITAFTTSSVVVVAALASAAAGTKMAAAFTKSVRWWIHLTPIAEGIKNLTPAPIFKSPAFEISNLQKPCIPNRNPLFWLFTSLDVSAPTYFLFTVAMVAFFA